MDIRAPFVADCEAAEAMEPGDCPFDDPPQDAEAAAVVVAGHSIAAINVNGWLNP